MGRRPGLVALAAALAGAALLIAAPSALAHAQLLGTSPASGATVATQPAEVTFESSTSLIPKVTATGWVSA